MARTGGVEGWWEGVRAARTPFAPPFSPSTLTSIPCIRGHAAQRLVRVRIVGRQAHRLLQQRGRARQVAVDDGEVRGRNLVARRRRRLPRACPALGRLGALAVPHAGPAAGAGRGAAGEGGAPNVVGRRTKGPRALGRRGGGAARPGRAFFVESDANWAARLDGGDRGGRCGGVVEHWGVGRPTVAVAARIRVVGWRRGASGRAAEQVGLVDGRGGGAAGRRRCAASRLCGRQRGHVVVVVSGLLKRLVLVAGGCHGGGSGAAAARLRAVGGRCLAAG